MANVAHRPETNGRSGERKCPRCGALYTSDALFCPRDGSPLEIHDDGSPETDPYIGTIVSDDIEIRAVAGVGAMGRVYRAHQRGIDRDVAVKILHRELSGNTQLVQRFNREAKIASRLQHPHVVEVYLAGQLPDKALFIVMEFLDGLSLGAALAEAGGSLAPGRAIAIALQICDAIGEAHARGVVHRDLKPENVMLVRRGETSDYVKVLDFGIAKVATVEQSMQTAAGLVFGTARYISPEGAQGTTVGPAGDVYSLAVIVYQLLAGRTPFDAEPVGLLIKHIHEAPPPLTSWPRARDIPPAVAKVVMDNLAKDPAQRAANGRVFGQQLAQAAREANLAFSEVGVVARLAHADSTRGGALEPTLDDASALAAPRVLPLGPGATVRLQSAPPSALPLPPPEDPTSRSFPGAPAPAKRRPWAFVLLAFLLGAALAVLGSQQLEKHADAVHDRYVAKTRAALADSRYVTPPGDCVRDLVVAGLKRWPDDLDLLQLRSTASMELVTRAMVAQNGGDLGGAHDLARDATQLDPTDHSAALLLDQYDDELKLWTADGGAPTGRPRVLFTALPPARAGARVDLTLRVMPGTLGATARIQDVHLTLYEHSDTVNGVKIPLAAAGAVHTFHTSIAAPKPGNYDVVFEALMEGASLRAVRELTVLP
ncbi:MAG: serine/threonine protein kinase [Labilithrix sp.]|nr:serine/threonine protein kinase [Labilithrix sp.]